MPLLSNMYQPSPKYQLLWVGTVSASQEGVFWVGVGGVPLVSFGFGVRG